MNQCEPRLKDIVPYGWKGNDSKSLDGMHHAKKGSSRKRKAHGKRIETKLRQAAKKALKEMR